MNLSFVDMLNLFAEEDKSRLLTKGYFGVERETQRITADGNLALTSHPVAFGDKAENPRITTDFSESQIEMITPVSETVEKVRTELEVIHNEVTKGIGEELLWPFSMPPRLPDEEDIPIAIYPDSDQGRILNTYRSGLSLRYGKKMQMISGLHYNFSFADEMIDYLYSKQGEGKSKRDFLDSLYFSIIRNFLRYRWLLIYLFGASPLYDNTYSSVIDKEIDKIDECCPCAAKAFRNMGEHATSLRVSRFGYTDTIDPRQNIYFNSMEEYSRKLHTLISTKSEKYAELGVFRNGQQVQLNNNILQKESEFYSSIRPKQNVGIGETQLNALEERGVKYIEVRILDINPYDKLGISLNQMYFLQVFMNYCLLEQSDLLDEETFISITSNHNHTALCGRNRDLLLKKYGVGEVPLKDWGCEIFSKLEQIALLMDRLAGDEKYIRSIELEVAKLTDISNLPSEKMYQEIKKNNANFLEYGIALAKKYK